MVVDYILELPCEPRRRFGRDGLLQRVRLLHQLEEGPRSANELHSARLALFDLRPLAFHCARCPANYQEREYGCCGAFELPVSAEAEEWLVDLLPPRLRGHERAEAVRALCSWLDQAHLTGEALEDGRGDGRLLRGRRPAVKTYGPLLRRTRLTSTQLLQALLQDGRLSPECGQRLLRALGVWEDGGTGPDGVPEVVFTQPEEEGDDPSIAGLKRLFLALLTACSLDAALLRRSRMEEAPEEAVPARHAAQG